MESTGGAELDLDSIGSLYADSYNSANGGPEDRKENAVIRARGEINAPSGSGGEEGRITVRGDLVADHFSPSTSGLGNGNGHRQIVVSGDIVDDAPEMDDPSVRGLISEKFDAFPETPDERHDDTVVVENEETFKPGTIEINGALHVNGDSEVILDTREGDVELMIHDGLELTDDARFFVEGSGTATVYVGDLGLIADNATVDVGDGQLRTYTKGDVMLIGPGIEIDVGEKADANKFWLFTSGNDVLMKGNNQFKNEQEGTNGFHVTGVFFVPDSTVTIRDHVTIRGAVVADQYTVGNADLELRYDEAIANSQGLLDESIPTVSYLYVSLHPIKVTD